MFAWPETTVRGGTIDRHGVLRSWLHRTLRRWHGRCTHHWFAIDALPFVQTRPGDRLVALLLRQYDRYLAGTTVPDDRICDHQNHVIHVTQGDWGGAPRVAQTWYDRLVRSLRQDAFADAAHAAGVLSHYFVDPMQPTHTMQCARGRIIHRPLQWSVCNAYDEILRVWIRNDLRVVVQLSDRPDWLGEAILHGARYANRHYRVLVNEYDLQAAWIDPASGLTDPLRMSLAGLLGVCITGWARVLERAASDAERLRRKPLPDVSLGLPCITATLRIPLQIWLRRLENRLEENEIDELIHEYHTRGRLQRHLPADVDIMHRVARVYADELCYQRQRDRSRRGTVSYRESAQKRDRPGRRAA